MNAIPQPETFLISDVFTVSAPRRNPGSVAEMRAELAYRMNQERPLTDAELAVKYPEDDTDDDAKHDPNYFAWLDD